MREMVSIQAEAGKRGIDGRRRGQKPKSLAPPYLQI